MKVKLKSAASTTYTPKSPEDAAKWWNAQVRKKRIIFWDSLAKRMISSDDGDLRKLPCKDLSKCARIYSEANIINLLKGEWTPTPTHMGMVIADLRRMVVLVGLRNADLASKTRAVLKKISSV